jgi:hypothetical protein
VSAVAVCNSTVSSAVFNNSVCTTKKTQHFTVLKISLLMLFKDIITVYIENHMKYKKAQT